MAGARWLEAGGGRVAGGRWLEGGWRQVAGGWLEEWEGGWLESRMVAGGSWLDAAEEAGGWRQVAGGRWLEAGGGGSGWRVAAGWLGGWLEVAGMVLGGGVAGLVGFGIAYRYRTEPKLRNTGNTYTAKYRIRIGIDGTARLQPWF